MNSKVSVKKNFVMNMFLTMSSIIFPVITFPYVSRILLPEGTGKVTFAVSFIAYFNLISQLGIPTYGIRACAKVRDNKCELTRVAHELLLINQVMCIFSYIILGLVLIFIPRFRQDRLLYIIISFTVFLSAIGMEWLYKGLEQYTYITVRSVIFKFIALLATFLLIHTKKDYVIYGGISIFASSASNVLNFINAHKYIGFKPIGGYDIKRHLKPVLVFFALSCAATIYSNLNAVMLGLVNTDADVGYYNAAIKIKTILVSVVTSLGAVLLPRASYYLEHNEVRKYISMTQKALRFVLIFATPISVYFILYAKEGILFLSGNAYEKSILPMQIVMPTVFLIGLNDIMGTQILVPKGKEKYFFFFFFIAALVDLILCFILLDPYASVGSAIGLLSAEATVTFILFLFVKREMGNVFKNLNYYQVLIGCMIAGASSLVAKFLPYGSFVKLAISSIVFGLVYFGFMIILRNDIMIEIIETSVNMIKNKLDFI